MSSDRYEERPALDAMLARKDAEELTRWWPKLSPSEREAANRTMHNADESRVWAEWAQSLSRREVPVDDDVPLDAAETQRMRVADTHEVRLWVRRLQRVISDMPDSVWLLASIGGVTVYAHPPGSQTCEIDPSLVIATTSVRRILPM